MDIENLTIKEAREIASIFGDAAKNPVHSSPADGRNVIVRSRGQGVMFGQFGGNVGDTVTLSNARQLWRWKAAKGGTLVDVAEAGVDPSGCKFSATTAQTTIFSACAVIDVSDESAATINSVEGGEWS